MRKLFLLPLLLLSTFLISSCKDDGKGNPYDNRDDDRNRNKNDNRDEGMDRDYGALGSSILIGKWSIRDIESASGEELTEAELSAMRNSTFEFVGNGTYIATSRMPDGNITEYGTYIYNSSTKRLTTIGDKDGERLVQQVKFKGKDWLMLTNEEGTISLERY